MFILNQVSPLIVFRNSSIDHIFKEIIMMLISFLYTRKGEGHTDKETNLLVFVSPSLCHKNIDHHCCHESLVNITGALDV